MAGTSSSPAKLLDAEANCGIQTFITACFESHNHCSRLVFYIRGTNSAQGPRTKNFIRGKKRLSDGKLDALGVDLNMPKNLAVGDFNGDDFVVSSGAKFQQPGICRLDQHRGEVRTHVCLQSDQRVQELCVDFTPRHRPCIFLNRRRLRKLNRDQFGWRLGYVGHHMGDVSGHPENLSCLQLGFLRRGCGRADALA